MEADKNAIFYCDEGKQILEYLTEAKNYNQFLENILVNFIGSATSNLDFGAGGGEFALRLREHQIEVGCVEIGSQLREELQQKKFTTHPDLTLCENYDRIYSLNVLEHIEDDLTTLKEMHRALNENGKLLLYVPAFNALYTETDRLVGHFRRYSKQELTSKVKLAGFKITQVNYVDSIGFVSLWILKNFTKSSPYTSASMIKFYDRRLFPMSRILDKCINGAIGKNLLLVAQKCP